MAGTVNLNDREARMGQFKTAEELRQVYHRRRKEAREAHKIRGPVTRAPGRPWVHTAPVREAARKNGQATAARNKAVDAYRTERPEATFEEVMAWVEAAE